MTVTALIVDDEPVARAGLRSMLRSFEWVSIAGEAADGLSAIEAINRLRPDLVFLDVQLPGMIGTEVARKIEHQPCIIFTTAYSQHAVTAFELSAVDYLLKPFGQARLASAMERVRSAIGEPGPDGPLQRLAGALSGKPITRLFVRVGGALVPVPVESVSLFKADGDYVMAYAGESRYLLSLPLARLEARLDPGSFMRVHRSHVVNIGHVKSFVRDARGNLEAELKNGVRVAVSRGRAQQLRQLGL